MSIAKYEIIDEPKPGGMAQLIVNPLWPLLSGMLVGAWFALPWFVLNGFALGSSNRTKELLVAICGLVLAGLALFGIVLLHQKGAIPTPAVRYAVLLTVAIKLAAYYWIYLLQEPAFSLFEYFGGQGGRGVMILLLGYFFLRKAAVAALDSTFWQLVLL